MTSKNQKKSFLELINYFSISGDSGQKNPATKSGSLATTAYGGEVRVGLRLFGVRSKTINFLTSPISYNRVREEGAAYTPKVTIYYDAFFDKLGSDKNREII